MNTAKEAKMLFLRTLCRIKAAVWIVFFKASNMKNPYFLLALLLAGCLLITCKKPQEAPQSPNTGATTKTTSGGGDTTASLPIVPINPGMLVGAWQVINDTTTTMPWGLWQGHPITTSNYVGTPADYYKFTAEGDAYTSLKGVIDTANYMISQDSVHVVYTVFNGQRVTGGLYNSFWQVTNLTAHTATITWLYVSPETATTSVTYLRR